MSFYAGCSRRRRRRLLPPAAPRPAAPVSGAAPLLPAAAAAAALCRAPEPAAAAPAADGVSAPGLPSVLRPFSGFQSLRGQPASPGGGAGVRRRRGRRGFCRRPTVPALSDAAYATAARYSIKSLFNVLIFSSRAFLFDFYLNLNPPLFPFQLLLIFCHQFKKLQPSTRMTTPRKARKSTANELISCCCEKVFFILSTCCQVDLKWTNSK